jgi:pimeloyl-ACP methyl ester carboxylesterase
LPLDQPEPFTIHVPEAVLTDLHDRLDRTRWPDTVVGAEWEDGVPLPYLRNMVAHWRHHFDWRLQEQRINAFANYQMQAGGVRVHFIHARGNGPHPLPLMLLHGWPSSFVEMLKIIPLLTDPAAHGGNPADAFDIVVPSLPGYAFSERPITRGFSYAEAAQVLVELMDKLGYPRFGVHAHDHGAAVMVRMNRLYPQHVIGYHTSEPGGEATSTPSEEERVYYEVRDAWGREDDGYARIQSTRPQTLAYGLNDSPVGLAGWILDKWYAWTAPPDGNLESSFTKDELLTNVMIYWVTETANSTARAYYEGFHPVPTGDAPLPGGPPRIQVPVGVIQVPTQPIERIPRSYAERRYADIRRWEELPRGGHFIVGEEPALVTNALQAFFRELRG